MERDQLLVAASEAADAAYTLKACVTASVTATYEDRRGQAAARLRNKADALGQALDPVDPRMAAAAWSMYGCAIQVIAGPEFRVAHDAAILASVLGLQLETRARHLAGEVV